ncbi:hypothetical protein BOSE62_110335 [Bosea sp. 62]|nr:hypothetical protein BOSE62_110335 [Bosea sp. 62]VXC58367.1 hypothetical protein BOSE29B_50245 [Bosea sp. 29B]
MMTAGHLGPAPRRKRELSSTHLFASTPEMGASLCAYDVMWGGRAGSPSGVAKMRSRSIPAA